MASIQDNIRLTEEEIKKSNYYLRRLELRVTKPFAIIDDNQIRGFRFGKPNAINYVILNVSRSISIINSMRLLCSNGFKGEMAILARSLLENTSKLQYVVSGLNRDGADRKTREFLMEFFSDNTRDVSRRPRYKPISQKDINRMISESVSRDILFNREFGIPSDIDNDNHQLEKIISNLYNEYSNHVHGRYPEMMDIYGELSTRLMTNGNRESDDIDLEYETELLFVLSSGVTKGFRTALLSLKLCNLINLDTEEMNFCMGNTILA